MSSFSKQFHITGIVTVNNWERSYKMRNECMIGLKAKIKQLSAACLVFCLSVPMVFPKEMDSVIPANNWGAVQALQPGAPISVRMTSHDRMEGDFLSLDSESIHLMMGIEERVFPRSSIIEVRQLRVPDRNLDGALIGTGIGAAFGGIGAFATNAPFRGEDAWGALMIMTGAGIGAVIGLTADAMIKRSKLLYRR
jgi:hypothetical protein